VVMGLYLSACSENKNEAAATSKEMDAPVDIVEKQKVKVSLFSWPGYAFWFIAKEKNLAPELDLEISIIEDPYESFAQMGAGQLDITCSTVEYGPIAADTGGAVKLVAYTNPSYGTDKIILAPGINSAQDLKGKEVAVLEGGLTQIFFGIWLEQNGMAFNDVKYVNLVMDDAVAAMVSGKVAGAEFWEPFGSKVLSTLQGSRAVATSSEDYWIKSGLLGDGMYMSSAFLKDKPELAVKAFDAYWKAVDWWLKNPEEGAKIIAEGLKFPVEDVYAVIGPQGPPFKGGIYVFNFEEAAKFFGVIEGEPPLGLKHGHINEHWNLTSDWWLKFGLIKEKRSLETGVDFAPMKGVAELRK